MASTVEQGADTDSHILFQHPLNSMDTVQILQNGERKKTNKAATSHSPPRPQCHLKFVDTSVHCIRSVNVFYSVEASSSLARRSVVCSACILLAMRAPAQGHVVTKL